MNFKYCPLCKHKLNRVNHDGFLRLKCSGCGWINYENPIPCVAVVVKRDKKILLVQRGVPPHKGRWCLPSGFIEIEETSQAACLRELKEETNLNGKILNLIGVYTQKSKMYKKVLVIAYEVKAENKDPMSGSDTKDAKFFSLNKLPGIPFQSHLKIIKDSKRRRL